MDRIVPASVRLTLSILPCYLTIGLAINPVTRIKMNEQFPEGLSVRAVVKAIIRRCGEDAGKSHNDTGQPYHLREAARETGLSRTALMKIADGSTQQPDTKTFQKLASHLKNLRPLLEIDGVEFSPDWIELMRLNEVAKPEPEKKPPLDRKTQLLEQISALMEELKQV